MLKLTENLPDLELCAKLLLEGNIAAIPTETVYGLAAVATDSKAVEKIFLAKGRPADNPLIIHIANITDAERYACPSADAYRLMERFFPGPLTLIMKKKDIVPNIVTAGLDSVAVRMPSHKIAHKIIELTGHALSAPSANISGRPSPTTAQHVIHDFENNEYVSAVVDGGSCRFGVESTVVSLVSEAPTLLRPGFITADELREVVPDLKIAEAVLKTLPENEKALSPGLKHKHYAPSAQTVCVRGGSEKATEYINNFIKAHNGRTTVICFNEEAEKFACKVIPYGAEKDSEAQAENLFAALRTADENGSDTIFIRLSSTEGVGLAVANRVLRACGFNVINV